MGHSSPKCNFIPESSSSCFILVIDFLSGEYAVGLVFGLEGVRYEGSCLRGRGTVIGDSKMFLAMLGLGLC